MQWTSDAPTEAGFYFMRGAIEIYLVRVYAPLGGGAMCIQYHGTDFEDTVDMLGGVEWYGPLTPPP